MKDTASTSVSDEAFAKRAERWTLDTPDTKEAYYIREIFESEYFNKTVYVPSQEFSTGLFPLETAVRTAVR